jgi:eukaryotic-like serine/threonine-protein kinase
MPKVQATLPPGTIIQGRYIIEGVLGNSNSGAIYLVRDRHVRQHHFALKEVSNSGEKDGHRFTFETTEFKKKFVHPALPQVYGAFQDDKNGRTYILMEYIEGPSLEVVRLLQQEQRFSLTQSKAIMSPIMDAVIYLHSQHPPLIHGNIKPSNIIESTDASAILVDFDLGKEYDAEKTITVAPSAKFGYEGPEQFIGVIGPGTDIYGLGATLYTLLTGIVPAGALSRLKKLSKKEPDPLVQINQIAPAIPEPVSKIIHRAMSMSSDDRFSTVEQFWEELQQASNATPVEQQTTEPAVAVPNEEKTEAETHSLVQQAQEPPVGIEEASTLTSDPTVHQPPESAGVTSDSPHTHVISGTVKSRITRPLQETVRARRFQKYGMLFLTLFAILVTLLGSIGVGASLWYYIVYHGSHSATSPSALLHKTTPHLSPTSTVVPTPSTSSAQIAALYNGTIYDVSANVTTNMSLTGIQHTQITIGGTFTGLHRTGTFNGIIDPQPPKHIQFTVKDSAGHVILSFDGHMQSDGELSGSYCSVDQDAQCTGEYGLWSVTPAS